MQTLNSKGNLIDFNPPKVMGIINVTPDSFYGDSRSETEKNMLIKAEKMLLDGASFIDIGGYSTRPGAEEISISEEITRVSKGIETILTHFPEAIISIDTFRSEVAKAAVYKGASIVNDVSGGSLDDKMFKTVAALRVPYILMHMRGTPKTMTKLTDYEDVTIEVLKYFSERIALARASGIHDIIADPGFGFAKTPSQSFELLSNMELLQTLDIPICIGVSRKSMIYKTLGISVEGSLNGTSILNTIALTKGADILRVHDVKEAVECVKLFQKLRE